MTGSQRLHQANHHQQKHVKAQSTRDHNQRVGKFEAGEQKRRPHAIGSAHVTHSRHPLVKSLYIGSNGQVVESRADAVALVSRDGIYSGDDLKSPHREYKVKRVLGKGSFGTVLLVADDKTNKDYALKVLTGTTPKGALRAYWEEITAMRPIDEAIEHRSSPEVEAEKQYVLHTADENYKTMPCFIVTPFYSGGDLFSFLEKEREHKTLTPQRVVKMMFQMTAGVDFMHYHLREGGKQTGRVHRDLKPENVLMDAHGNLIIADYGLATREGTRGTGGTPGYMSIGTMKWDCYQQFTKSGRQWPHSWGALPRKEDGTAQLSDDIFGLGCIFAELVRLKPLFERYRTESEENQHEPQFIGMVPEVLKYERMADLHLNQKQTKAYEEKVLTYYADVDQKSGMRSLLPFIDWFLYEDPAKRPTTTEALRHEHFSEFIKNAKNHPVQKPRGIDLQPKGKPGHLPPQGSNHAPGSARQKRHSHQQGLRRQTGQSSLGVLNPYEVHQREPGRTVMAYKSKSW